MFLNSFCASATPTTLTSTVTDTQTVTNTQTVTDTQTVTSTSTSIEKETVISVTTTTRSPTCTSRTNTDGQLCPATITTTAYLSGVQSNRVKTVSTYKLLKLASTQDILTIKGRHNVMYMT